MNIVKIVREKPFLDYIYRKSTSIFEIVPYYLFKEFLSDDRVFDLKTDLDRFEVCFLGPTDMKTISSSSEVYESEHELLERLTDGCLCLGMKQDKDIAAYTWCNLRGGLSLISPLKDNEVYLFDARTFKAYRGGNIAPYLRHQLYKHLNQIGRTKFFSYTSLFNTSAIKFFKKYEWHIVLKDYEKRRKVQD
jgi:ribosomal protein S18 acetylase RimI-like enzyme